jgi:hypothetical protein
MTTHLTEAQFADYLIGLSTAATRSHLLQCATCRDEMESFGSAITSFNQTSLAWSRTQAAANPVQIHAAATPQPPRARHLPWGIGLAFAAVLAFAVALPVLHHHGAQTAVAVSAPAADDSQGIREDNQMLAAIDEEISQPDASPVESFGSFRPESATMHARATAHEGRTQSPALRKNN